MAKLEFVYTPKHGSWLNMAEIELNVLGSQCLDRRIADKPFLTTEVAAWEEQRNQHASTVNWQFTLDNSTTQVLAAGDGSTALHDAAEAGDLERVRALIASLSEKSRLNSVAQSVVLAQLRAIDRQQRDGVSPDGMTRAHRAHVRHLIEVALDQ